MRVRWTDRTPTVHEPAIQSIDESTETNQLAESLRKVSPIGKLSVDIDGWIQARFMMDWSVRVQVASIMNGASIDGAASTGVFYSFFTF